MRRNSRITFRSIMRVKVFNPENNQLLGYVGDLSSTGLRVLSPAAMEAGGRMLVRIRTRDRVGLLREVDVRVYCVWTREKNTKTGYFEAGCTLEEPSEEYTDLVNSLQSRRRTD